jgi:hypothetical protein
MAIRVRNTEGIYETLDTGFHSDGVNTYYVSPKGRIWVVQSEEDLSCDGPVERLAADLDDVNFQPVNDLLTPDEALGHCRRIEEISGETLIGG